MAQSLSLASIKAGITEGSVSVASTQKAPGGFTVYRVVFKVKAQTLEGITVVQECEVWKRFSDFQQLSRQLELLHSQSKSVAGLPTIVRASYFDRFKDSVIEERRRSAESLLRFASRYHHLTSSPALHHFLSGATIVRTLPQDMEPATDTHRLNTEIGQPDTGMQLAPEEHNGAYGSDLGSPGSREPLPQTVAPEDGNWHDPSTGLPLTTLEGSPSNPSTVHLQAEAKRTTPTDLLTGSERPETHNPTGSRDASEDRDSNPMDGLSAAPPPQSRDSDSSSAVEDLLDFGSNDNGSCDDASKPAQAPAVVGSVKITQWSLEHSLKLRDEEGPPAALPEYIATLPDISEEEDRRRSLSHDDGIEREGEPREDRFRGKADSGSTSGESSSESDSLPAAGSLGGGLVFPQGGAETSSSGLTADPISLGTAETDAPPKKTPEDSLDRLNFDLTILPAAPAQPSTTTAASSGGGLDWWGEAFAETQNITDDFDTLVDQLGDNSPDAGAGATRAPRPPASKSLLPSHGSLLKPAMSDGSIVDSVKGLAETTSSSEQTLGRETGAAAAAGQRKALLRRLSDQMNPSATDSRGSAGKGRKSASATNSRSPSPSRRRNSPSLSDSNAYVIQAGRLIEKALEFEQDKEWEDAFDLFKAAVDVLLNGVQTDGNKQRREMVRRKTVEYLQHTEELYQQHLAQPAQPAQPAQQHTLTPPQQAAKPAPVAATPAVKPHLLPDFKVIGTIGKVILVESKHTGQTYVFKVLHKSAKAATTSGRGRPPKKIKNTSPLHCSHMVRLLHHYETSNQRIFLLLEHVRGGRLIDFVSGKREQWLRLKEAAMNPSPLTLIRQKSAADGRGGGGSGGGFGMETKVDSGIGIRPSPNAALESRNNTDLDEGLGHSSEQDDDEMDRMLNELSSIVPPSDLPVVTSSLGSNAADEEESFSTGSEAGSDSLDRLALMRKRLEECGGGGSEVKPGGGGPETSSDREHPVAVAAESGNKEPSPPGGGESRDRSEAGASTAINIQPPTPTVSTQDSLGSAQVTRTSGRSGTDSLAAHPRSSEGGKDSGSGGGSPGVEPRAGSGSPAKGSPGRSSPCFSPGSQPSSPNVGGVVDEWGRRLEDSVRAWAAQIILSLEHLHSHGVICRDLNLNNLLLDNAGQAMLTYFGNWDFVEWEEKYELLQMLYVAPELQGLVEPTPAADWWSLGAVLFEVLIGKRLVDCHPGGMHSHIPLRIPIALSPEAQSLLKQLLQVNPSERLGSGLAGVEEIKAHPFFTGIDWNMV